MLYQQGLADIIHCSPSEQVAYLLVERSSLLDRRENDTPKGHGGNLSVKPPEAETKAPGIQSSKCPIDTTVQARIQHPGHVSGTP